MARPQDWLGFRRRFSLSTHSSLATVFFSVMLKMAMAGVAPLAWQRKAWCVPYPKPAKPLGTVEAWRSIALLESSMKGIAKALRQKLLTSLVPCFRSGQGGSRPGSSLDYPIAITKLHTRKLAQIKQSGAILYIDGAAAF